jgi:HSP20 family protein
MTTEIQKKTAATPASADTTRRPYYRVLDGKDAFTVEVFMPGVAKGDYQVSLHNHELLVEGNKIVPIPPGAKWLHREIAPADYKLRLQLNVEVDPEGITAKSEDGVLNIQLPLAAEALPRQIKIQ